ncbi:pyridoxamine 5'-phosphate oxidase family protein [Rhizobium sp. BK399]|uniref:pyridoxamine 5'-phosphate oxidase family protein n=1 Tax=Rhizobium sp. BK399 TaxID=2587063 RepID=UPI00161CE40C|nr:pyridoxamine 5'-phosphate oxidase family protein [Rhizobium sp. BK399]MBB3545435.1 general stress protein 26 [Rhizobium sp. BK399]
MTTMTLQELSEKLRKIDVCMMTTYSGNVLSSRPMSNNGEVEYDGDSWFFSYEATRKIYDLKSNPALSLTFTAPPGLLGKPGIFVSVEGKAELIRVRQEFEARWTDGLNRWFPEKFNTPGMVLVKVHAEKIQYWDGEENGSISM